jgi:hypothetical protein
MNLDPNVDVVVIDTASPYEPSQFLGWPYVIEGTGDEGWAHDQPVKRWVYRFKENLGHLSRGGQDGAGRTFCKSIELGIEGGYDYVVIIETDLLFFRSVTEICRRLQRNGTKIAAVPNFQYQFPEFGVCFIDCRWAKEFDFIGKYNWKGSQPWPIPEVRIMNIVEDYLMLLPLYGIRIDQSGVTAATLSNYFPYFQIAWITHATTFDLYQKAIMMNNIALK